MGQGQPILLVHGYLFNSCIWYFQKKWLQKLLQRPIYTIDLGNPFLSIEEYVQKVKQSIEKIGTDLVLIGHSMGGLINILAANEHNLVRDVITIATPLEGTPIAYFGWGKNAQEMRPQSVLIQKVQNILETNSKIRVFHIAAQCDEIVLPGISAKGKKHPHYVIEDLGHLGVLYSKRVARKCSQFLR